MKHNQFDPDPEIAAAQRAFCFYNREYGAGELADLLCVSKRLIQRIHALTHRPAPGLADDLATHLEQSSALRAIDLEHITALRIYAENGRRLKETRHA